MDLSAALRRYQRESFADAVNNIDSVPIERLDPKHGVQRRMDVPDI